MSRFTLRSGPTPWHSSTTAAPSPMPSSSDIGKFAAALGEFGLPPRSVVAVGCDDFHLHWLLLLAFERLNVATASYHSGEGAADCGQLLAGVDLVLSDEHFPLHGAA